MITCLSLNPCIDKALSLPRFTPDAPNRAQLERVDLGGKGINVARTIRALGGECRLVGFDYRGAPVQSAMEKAGIAHALIALDAGLRVNLKLQETETGGIIEISEAGATVSQAALAQAEALLCPPRGSWAALSGSLPPGAPANTYETLCRRLHARGCLVAVDCDGPALRHALAAAPDLIKPNAQEFAALTQTNPEDETAVFAACQALHRRGVGMICLSQGPRGALLSTSRGCWHCKAAQVPVRSAMGAGDAMLAGLLLALERGDAPDAALRYASAAAGAAVMQPGTQPGDPQDAARILSGLTATLRRA